MTNTKEFKIALLRKGITAGELAEMAGMSRPSLSYKINNQRMFTVTEISKISEILGLSLNEKERIFFDNEVAKISTAEEG